MQKFLLKLPTDDLCKFMGISGALLLILLWVVTMLLDYANYNFENYDRGQRDIKRFEKRVEEIELREKAIKEDRIEENIYIHIRTFSDLAEEKIVLAHEKQRMQKRIEEFQEKNNPNYYEWLLLAKVIGLYEILWGLFYIGVLLFSFGFTFWLFRVQRPKDKLLKKELKIKELTIKKLELEQETFKKKRAIL